MNGKLVGIFLVVITLIAGAAVYWLQEYAYYDEVAAPAVEITAVNIASGEAEVLAVSDVEAIDATSSPIRFRACFRTTLSGVTMSETFEEYPQATPLNGPNWFDCYNAAEIGAALEAGEAMAFLSQRDIHEGVDRVIAVFPDGRAYAWHQLNETFDTEGGPLDE